MPHPNVQLLRIVDEAAAKEDPNSVFQYFTEDAKVHVKGNNKLAGEYQGTEQLKEIFRRYIEAAGDSYRFENHGYYADDEHGIFVQTSFYERGGQILRMEEVNLVHFRDGKISEMWFLPDDAEAFDKWIGQ